MYSWLNLFKFEQYQFALVLVTHESTQWSQFTHMRDSACARIPDGARKCSYSRVHLSGELALNLYRSYIKRSIPIKR